jgi:hypothetical protein
MANKPAHKKRAVKKPESAKVEPNEATAAKEAPAPNGGSVPSPNKDVVNAETAQVLRDADAGKNLLRYPSLEDIYKKDANTLTLGRTGTHSDLFYTARGRWGH